VRTAVQTYRQPLGGTHQDEPLYERVEEAPAPGAVIAAANCP
jgi:hypothetical protein